MRPVIENLDRCGMLSKRRRQPWKRTAGLVVIDASPTKAMTADGEPVDDAPYKLAAAAGFATALILLRLLRLLRLPFWVVLCVARAGRYVARREPSQSTAEQLVSAVKHQARRFPKAKCLEISLGAFFAGVLVGQAPRWCVGVLSRPPEPHAWIETLDTAIDSEPQTSDRTRQAIVRI
jgi:hypothetical protein